MRFVRRARVVLEQPWIAVSLIRLWMRYSPRPLFRRRRPRLPVLQPSFEIFGNVSVVVVRTDARCRCGNPNRARRKSDCRLRHGRRPSMRRDVHSGRKAPIPRRQSASRPDRRRRPMHRTAHGPPARSISLRTLDSCSCPVIVFMRIRDSSHIRPRLRGDYFVQQSTPPDLRLHFVERKIIVNRSVNYNFTLWNMKQQLNDVFFALSDPTRRAILGQLAADPATIGALGKPFDISAPAISRHVRILEKAGLIDRQKMGREHHCKLSTGSLRSAEEWIGFHLDFWQSRLNDLEKFLKSQDDNLGRP